MNTSQFYIATQGLAAVEYDEEAVVFNDETWETHVLNPAATAVLALIAETPRSIEEVAAALAQWLEPDESPDAMPHAMRSIAMLTELKLAMPLDDQSR